MNENNNLPEKQALEIAEVTSSYDWLKTQKHAWVQGTVLFPVRVDIVTVDFENQTANITTSYQSGTIPFDRLFQSQSECPCR